MSPFGKTLVIRAELSNIYSCEAYFKVPFFFQMRQKNKSFAVGRQNSEEGKSRGISFSALVLSDSFQGYQECSCVWLAFMKGLKDSPDSAKHERGHY